jgi:hypothetical protein
MICQHKHYHKYHGLGLLSERVSWWWRSSNAVIKFSILITVRWYFLLRLILLRTGGDNGLIRAPSTSITVLSSRSTSTTILSSLCEGLSPRTVTVCTGPRAQRPCMLHLHLASDPSDHLPSADGHASHRVIGRDPVHAVRSEWHVMTNWWRICLFVSLSSHARMHVWAHLQASHWHSESTARIQQSVLGPRRPPDIIGRQARSWLAR